MVLAIPTPGHLKCSRWRYGTLFAGNCFVGNTFKAVIACLTENFQEFTEFAFDFSLHDLPIKYQFVIGTHQARFQMHIFY